VLENISKFGKRFSSVTHQAIRDTGDMLLPFKLHSQSSPSSSTKGNISPGNVFIYIYIYIYLILSIYLQSR
jgi:hypothetical protein